MCIYAYLTSREGGMYSTCAELRSAGYLPCVDASCDGKGERASGGRSLSVELRWYVGRYMYMHTCMLLHSRSGECSMGGASPLFPSVGKRMIGGLMREDSRRADCARKEPCAMKGKSKARGAVCMQGRSCGSFLFLPFPLHRTLRLLLVEGNSRTEHG